jgi:hypothetical protein
MRLAAIGGILALSGLALLGFDRQCQPPKEMRREALNLSFSDGAPGAAPTSWYLSPEWFLPPHDPVHEAKIVAGAACHGSPRCATVYAVHDSSSTGTAFLYQIVDASPYRGKSLIFSADVRTDVKRGSVARLLLRVHQVDCSTSFRDDMGDKPINSGEWKTYRIKAPLTIDARDVEFGAQLMGPGQAWIDHISLTPSAD